MARVGSFMGPTTPFGVPTDTVAPSDNNIIPDPTIAAADAAKAAADDLYQQIQNLLKDPNAK